MAFGDINIFIGLAINGLFTGLGATIGTYLANKQILNRIEKIKGALNGRRDKKK